jgi:hypothetical protein
MPAIRAATCLTVAARTAAFGKVGESARRFPFLGTCPGIPGNPAPRCTWCFSPVCDRSSRRSRRGGPCVGVGAHARMRTATGPSLQEHVAEHGATIN